MRSINLTANFEKILSLIKSESSRDVMLINETSPAMVRYLGKDNTFRTLQLSKTGDTTNLQVTKSDDTEESLLDFKGFITGLAKKSSGKLDSAKLKDSAAKKQAQEEAVAHRDAMYTRNNIQPKEDLTSPIKKKASAKKTVKKKVTTKKVTKKKATPAKTTKKKPSKKKK